MKLQRIYCLIELVSRNTFDVSLIIFFSIQLSEKFLTYPFYTASEKKNNYVLYIISVLAAALPNIPDPQNSPQYNLAGNARTLLTLLRFANWDHYSYLLNCI